MPTDIPTANVQYFRKRPVVISAYRAGGGFSIETLEGVMHVSPGDWVITGVNGETYPCKPDIFEKTYEPVDNVDVGEPPDCLQDCSNCEATEGCHVTEHKNAPLAPEVTDADHEAAKEIHWCGKEDTASVIARAMQPEREEKKRMENQDMALMQYSKVLADRAEHVAKQIPEMTPGLNGLIHAIGLVRVALEGKE